MNFDAVINRWITRVPRPKIAASGKLRQEGKAVEPFNDFDCEFDSKTAYPGAE
jgi:hypothetical protein